MNITSEISGYQLNNLKTVTETVWKLLLLKLLSYNFENSELFIQTFQVKIVHFEITFKIESFISK